LVQLYAERCGNSFLPTVLGSAYYFMKCLVTGGAGFIGSHLTDALVERGDEVLVIDNLATGKKENINPKAVFFNLDICDFEQIEPFFKGVDYVFHLAALPRVVFSLENPLLTSKVNILGSLSVFKAAANNNVKRVVFAGSSSVYGDQTQSPLKEDMTPNPISPYGLQKLTAERFATLFSDIYNTQIVTLRYFNVYGPRADSTSEYSLALAKFLQLKKENKPLTIFGTGEQTRGFTYILDVVKANILASESEKLKGGEVINIGSKESYSVNQLADLVGGEKTYLPKRAGDPMHTKADISKAKELLGWEPQISLEKGVELTKQWFNNL